MAIDAKLIKELRERTGAGIADCKKALDEAQNDVEKAAVWLREKGIAKAVKKASRVSAEGIFNYVVKGNDVLLYEVNCETDFVASNAKFKGYVEDLGEVFKNNDVKCTECALEAKNADGVAVKDLILSYTAIIGEKIDLRNVSVVSKTDDQVFGIYKHFDNKTVVVVVMNGGDETLAKEVAMHVCVNDPKYLDASEADQAWLESERDIITKEAKEDPKNANKPAEILARMIEGRVQKELKEICLVDQPFFKEPGLSVSAYCKQKNATIVSFSRNAVGAGIEKKANNFVEEVMSQAQGK